MEPDEEFARTYPRAFGLEPKDNNGEEEEEEDEGELFKPTQRDELHDEDDERELEEIRERLGYNDKVEDNNEEVSLKFILFV